MKKKFIFLLLFCLSLSLSSYKVSETVTLDSKASECVAHASGIVHEIADAFGEDPNDNLEFYLELYMNYYTGCLSE